MQDDIQLDSADFITIGTIGPPGQRVFHLQAGENDMLLTLTIEKFQASAIADSIMQLIEQLEEEYSIVTPEIDPADYDLDLREPIQPIFRVGQMALGYDAAHDQIYLILNELTADDIPSTPRTVRIGASREQMRVLVDHARHVVEQGRPICGNCGQPIDPEGHFCPQSNGHRKRVSWA